MLVSIFICQFYLTFFSFRCVCVSHFVSVNYRTNKLSCSLSLSHSFSHKHAAIVDFNLIMHLLIRYIYIKYIPDQFRFFPSYFAFNRVHGWCFVFILLFLSFFFYIVVSFQWLPYLHFTFSIHTNLFTFSLRFILLLCKFDVVAIRHQWQMFGMAVWCARAHTHLPLTLND